MQFEYSMGREILEVSGTEEGRECTERCHWMDTWDRKHACSGGTAAHPEHRTLHIVTPLCMYRLSDSNGENIAHVPYFLLCNIHGYVILTLANTAITSFSRQITLHKNLWFTKRKICQLSKFTWKRGFICPKLTLQSFCSVLRDSNIM